MNFVCEILTIARILCFGFFVSKAFLWLIPHRVVTLTNFIQDGSYQHYRFQGSHDIVRGDQPRHIWVKTTALNIFCLRDYFMLRSQFLGAFATLRKVTVSFSMSVRLPAWNNSASTGWICMKFDISEFFENLWGEFRFDYNLRRITVLYIETYIFFYNISLSSSQNEKCFRQKL